MEITVIANETHQKAIAYFKVAEQYLYKFLMEVKEIRDKQYYKALGFNSFDAYCETSWSIKRDFMDQRIQIADAFGNEREFADTYRQLGHSKSLFLARLEPERRQEVMTQPLELPNGEVKTVNDATVRQLKQLEKEKQEAERRAQTAETEKQHFEKLWNQAKNQPARTIEKTVEVVPPDYHDLKKEAVKARELNTENIRLVRANQEIRETYEEKLTQQNKRESVKRDLQKYLAEQLRAVTMNHDSAILMYSSIQGDKEAYEILMRYLTQYESIIKKQFSEWEQLTTLRAIN